MSNRRTDKQAVTEDAQSTIRGFTIFERISMQTALSVQPMRVGDFDTLLPLWKRIKLSKDELERYKLAPAGGGYQTLAPDSATPDTVTGLELDVTEAQLLLRAVNAFDRWTLNEAERVMNLVAKLEGKPA